MHLSHLRIGIHVFKVTRLMRKIIYLLSGLGNMVAILLYCQQGSQKLFTHQNVYLKKFADIEFVLLLLTEWNMHTLKFFILT